MLLLLSTVALASALPLKKGNTWTWRLHNTTTDSTNWRTATVIDSARHDSGIAWRLVVRDSGSRAQDTATILRRKDGSQNWMKASQWILWDPNPPTATDWRLWDSGQEIPEDTASIPWGRVLTNKIIGGNACNLFYQRNNSGVPAGCRTFAPFEIYDSSSLPPMEWTDSLGFLGARGLDGFDWALQQMNHRPRAFSGRLSIPSPGTTLIWEKTRIENSWSIFCGVVSNNSGCSTVGTDSTRAIESWKFLSVTDSTGWKQVRILRTIQGPGDSTSTDTLKIRAHPETGSIIPMLPQTEGWWIFCDDDSSPNGFERRQWRFHHSMLGNMLESSSSFGAFDPVGELQTWSSDTTHSDLNGRSNRSIRIQRLDPASLHRRSFSNPTTFSLSALASLHPDLPVRWTDARGHHRQIPASSLSQHAPAKGVLFLEATLPDGSHWRGQSLDLRNDR
jgi:hypothetical protein